MATAAGCCPHSLTRRPHSLTYLLPCRPDCSTRAFQPLFAGTMGTMDFAGSGVVHMVRKSGRGWLLLAPRARLQRGSCSLRVASAQALRLAPCGCCYCWCTRVASMQAGAALTLETRVPAPVQVGGGAALVGATLLGPRLGRFNQASKQGHGRADPGSSAPDSRPHLWRAPSGAAGSSAAGRRVGPRTQSRIPWQGPSLQLLPFLLGLRT